MLTSLRVNNKKVWQFYQLYSEKLTCAENEVDNIIGVLLFWPLYDTVLDNVCFILEDTVRGLSKEY